MQIPNFNTEEGSILYQNTVGRLISPRVAEILLAHARARIASVTVRRILDLGCGPGTLSLPLARKHPELDIVATDASAAMIALAETEAAGQSLVNVHFRRMNAGHIELEPESFDLVLCNLAFPFFVRPHESMREIFEMVKPGGSACFTVPGRRTWMEFFALAESVLGEMISMARPFLAKFTQAEVLPEALAAAGFTERMESRTLLPFSFPDGQAVLGFFAELFHLLDYVPTDLKSELAGAIDQAHPAGFTMHYEAVLLCGRRPFP